MAGVVPLVGLNSPKIRPLASFSDEIMCIEAAIEERAVALISIIAAAREIERGRIIVPVAHVIKDPSYFLVCPQEKAQFAKVRAFEDWPLQEAYMFRDSAYGRRFLPH